MHVYESPRELVEDPLGPRPAMPRSEPSRILWLGVIFNVLSYSTLSLVVLAWWCKGLPGRRIAISVSGGMIVSLATVVVPLAPGMRQPPYLTGGQVLSAGWPFRAVRMESLGEHSEWGHFYVLITTDDGFYELDDDSYELGARWRGLAREIHLSNAPSVIGNWAFWSAVLASGLFGVAAIVSRRRRAKGQCPKCGYAMAAGGLDRCPECGA